MRLVDSVGVIMAELMDDLGYPVVVLGSKCIADETFELEGSALSLVVELVVECFGDVDVHGGKAACMPALHGAAACVSHH